MSADNRRQAQRVPFGVPVQIDTEAGPVEAGLIDVSRTGARIRILTSEMGYPPTLDMTETALQVAAMLPPHFEARLHYRVLGPLLHRGMNMMRIAVPLEAPDLIELGCRFDRPLGADDIVALGAPLPGAEPAPLKRDLGSILPPDPPVPALQDDEEIEEAKPEPKILRVLPPSEPERPPLPRSSSGLHRRYRAYIGGTLACSPPALSCWSDYLSRQLVRVRVPRAGYEAEDVAGATVRFTSYFGNAVELKLVEGHVHLWTGHARVCGLELPEDRDEDMLITFAFARELRPAELKRLRLEALSA